jgi:cytoskeletal protein CcmA (bactofilin family)
MAKSISTINNTQTFQNWLSKTNEMVGILQTDAMTASAGAGDTTTGNATLTGDFTASNLISNTLLSTNDIGARTNSSVNFRDPILVTSTAQACATFSFGSGGQVNFTDGSLTWLAGIESSNPGNFVIDTGTSPVKFSLSTAGTLTVPDAVVTGTLSVGSINIGGGGSGLDTDDINEQPGATNLWFTDARARAAIRTQDIDALNVDADTLDSLNSTQFVRSDANDTISGEITFSNTVDFNGTVNINGTSTFGGNSEIDGNLIIKNGSTSAIALYNNGDLIATGDITTNGSISDERLKENVVRLNNALEKVTQINGYTFNYKDRPDETMPGVIAQEIEKVLPEVVYEFEQENESYKAVRYANIVPLLIEAIKDLKAKVDDLEGRLNGDGI